MIWGIRILGAVAGGMGAFIGWQAWQHDSRVPVTKWHRVEAVNSPVRAGDPLQVRIHRSKVRDDCPVASDRQAIDADGRAWDLPSAVWQGGEAGTPYIRYTYRTRADMPPGEYTLRVFLTYTCPEFVWTTQQPDARFRVAQ